MTPSNFNYSVFSSSPTIEIKNIYYITYNQIPNEYVFFNVNSDLLNEYLIKNNNLIIREISFDSNNVNKFKNSLILLKNNIAIHINYGKNSTCNCTLLYLEKHYIYKELVDILSIESLDNRNNLNLITYEYSTYILTPLPIKNVSTDITKYYNDDFIEINNLILERLNTSNDKGIVLLHGEPGTGKSTYLRHLISNINKKIMFLPPNMAETLTDPAFLAFLIQYPNSILIIEDAENVIKNRVNTNSSTVSNILNISDGLLSDCLNIQTICTFNNDINDIDPALMRKGRIIAKYEFGKLDINKSNNLLKEYGFEYETTKPMTIADIINNDSVSYEKNNKMNIGF